jgi:hypothetical protein
MNTKKLKKLRPKVSVKTKLVIIDGKKTCLHIAEGPNTHSLAITNSKDKLFITSAQNPSVQIETTADELNALAANIAAGNYASILAKK